MENRISPSTGATHCTTAIAPLCTTATGATPYALLHNCTKFSPLNTSVSIYPAAWSNTKDADINLLKWLSVPDPALIRRMELVRSIQDKKEQKQAKNAMPCITVSGTFGNPRSDDSLISHTGLIALDIDPDQNPGIDFSVLREFIPKIQCVAYCGKSIRGQGLFCIIPISEPKMHREHFRQLQEDFKTNGIVVDPSCNNPGRLRFYSYDPEAYFNHEAEIYHRIPPPPSNAPKCTKRSGSTYSEAQTVYEFAMLRTMQKGIQFVEGSRHEFIFRFVSILNTFGIPQQEVEEWIGINLMPLYEIRSNCISSVYKRYVADHGKSTFNNVRKAPETH